MNFNKKDVTYIFSYLFISYLILLLIECLFAKYNVSDKFSANTFFSAVIPALALYLSVLKYYEDKDIMLKKQEDEKTKELERMFEEKEKEDKRLKEKRAKEKKAEKLDLANRNYEKDLLAIKKENDLYFNFHKAVIEMIKPLNDIKEYNYRFENIILARDELDIKTDLIQGNLCEKQKNCELLDETFKLLSTQRNKLFTSRNKFIEVIDSKRNKVIDSYYEEIENGANYNKKVIEAYKTLYKEVVKIYDLYTLYETCNRLNKEYIENKRQNTINNIEKKECNTCEYNKTSTIVKNENNKES